MRRHDATSNPSVTVAAARVVAGSRDGTLAAPHVATAGVQLLCPLAPAAMTDGALTILGPVSAEPAV